MNKGVVIGGIAIGGILLAGYNYRRGIDGLQYGLQGISIQGTQIGLVLNVFNPTRWSYPVPALYLNVFDAQGQYLGALRNDAMQWVGPGYSLIYATLLPNYGTLASLLVSLAGLTDWADSLTIEGIIQVGPLAVPLNTQLQLS